MTTAIPTGKEFDEWFAKGPARSPKNPATMYLRLLGKIPDGTDKIIFKLPPYDSCKVGDVLNGALDCAGFQIEVTRKINDVYIGKVLDDIEPKAGRVYFWYKRTT